MVIMPKERAQNPATAHLKSLKSASIKKNKAQIQQQRVEKLARRNPDRLQKQIEELQGLKEAQGGKLRPKDAEVLAELERDLRGVRKAREMRGEDNPLGRDRRKGDDIRREDRDGGWGRTHLGKRRRDEGAGDERDSTDTDPDVRDIPMPRDTPPPVPPKWIRDKARKRGAQPPTNQQDSALNSTTEPEPPPKAPRTAYSSAPQMRDLRKEATDKFMPAAVRARLQEQEKQKKGERKLPEPEDIDAQEERAKAEQRRIEEEEEAFQRELEEDQRETEQELAAGQGSLDADTETPFKPTTEEGRGVRAIMDFLDTTDSLPGVSSGNHNVEIEEIEDEDD